MIISSGKTFNLRPIKPTKELKLEAESKDSLLIPSDLYIPHSIDQFINRGGGSQFHPDPFVYGRKLARRIGAVSTAVGVPLALGATKGLIDKKIGEAFSETINQWGEVNPNIWEENTQFVEDLAQSLNYEDGSEIPSTIYNLIDDKIHDQVRQETNLGSLKFIEKGINYLGGGGNILTTGLGWGLGDIAGLAVYNNLLKDNHFENI